MTECSRNLAVYDRTQQGAWPAGRLSGIDVSDAFPEGAAGPSLYLPVLRGDAVLVVLHVVDPRSYRLWIDGGAASVDLAFGPGEMTEFAMPAVSRPAVSGQWFHFYVPRNGTLGPLGTEERHLPFPPSLRISDAIDQRLGECLVKAVRLAAASDPLIHDHLLKTLLECLLLSLKRHASRMPVTACAPGLVQRGGLAPWQVRRAKQIMDEKLEEAVAIEELAAACRLSKSHFARAFKVTTGQSPHRWHLGHRVDRAKRLMVESDQSLADIALVCGFADQSHFAKVFSRFVGFPPGTWRRAQERAVTPALPDMPIGGRPAGNDNIRERPLASAHQ